MDLSKLEEGVVALSGFLAGHALWLAMTIYLSLWNFWMWWYRSMRPSCQKTIKSPGATRSLRACGVKTATSGAGVAGAN